MSRDRAQTELTLLSHRCSCISSVNLLLIHITKGQKTISCLF